MLKVSYHAEEQLKRLSPPERRELNLLLADADRLEQTKKVETSGRFVSRFGENMRVVWQRDDRGDIVALTVVAR